MPAQPIVHTENKRAKPHIEDVSLKEVKIGKFWVALISRQNSKYGGEELHVVIY